MRLSNKEVEHIAALARLALTDDEKRRYAGQLSDILNYVAHLDELDTEHISPADSVLEGTLRLREDQPHPGLPHDDVMHNASETEDGQFKVPPVLGE